MLAKLDYLNLKQSQIKTWKLVQIIKLAYFEIIWEIV